MNSLARPYVGEPAFGTVDYVVSVGVMIEWSSPTGGYREQSRQTSDARLRRESIVEGQDPVYTVRLHDSQVQAVPR